MKTYILSIYRQDQENPDVLAGIVEEAGGIEKKVFHSFEGLRQILSTIVKAENQPANPGARKVKPRHP